MDRTIKKERVIDRARLSDVARQFEAALSASKEEAIHMVMAEHDDVFFAYTHAISKYRLADAFIPDFITVVPGTKFSNSPQGRVRFVELERADVRLFTKSGDPSAKLTHAIRQIRNWKTWVASNNEYLIRELEKRLDAIGALEDRGCYGLRHGFVDTYEVFIGRRSTLTIHDRMLLAQMNEDFHHRFKVSTYDTLLDVLVNGSRHHQSNRYALSRSIIE